MATEKSLTDILNASPEGWSEHETRTIFEVLDTVHINYTFDACGYRFRDHKGRFVAKDTVKQLVAGYTSALQEDEHRRVRSALRGLKDVVRVHSVLHGLKDAVRQRGIPAHALVYSSPSDQDIPLQDLVSPPVSTPVIPLEESARLSYRAATGDQVYLLRRRIPAAPGYTAAEQRFFQEGDDMSYVHGLLSGEISMPPTSQQPDSHNLEMHTSAPFGYLPVNHRLVPEFRRPTRLFRAAGAALVAGMALFASCVSGLYERNERKQTAVSVHDTTRYDAPASGSSIVGTYK